MDMQNHFKYYVINIVDMSLCGWWHQWQYFHKVKPLRVAVAVCTWHYSDVIMSTMALQITSQGYDYLLNRLLRRRSKKTPKLRVTGLCEGIHRWRLCEGNSPVNSPHKGPVTRKMLPFDDVIMMYGLKVSAHDMLHYELQFRSSHGTGCILNHNLDEVIGTQEIRSVTQSAVCSVGPTRLVTTTATTKLANTNAPTMIERKK